MFMHGTSHRLITALFLSIALLPSAVPMRVSAAIEQAPVTTLYATQVATGENHACALTSEGTVMCWGDNESGQLGDGTTTSRSVPVAVNGLSHVTALTAGDEHTCALLESGIVRCWGGNELGQLGTGDAAPISSATPLTVSAPLSNVVALSAGYHHTCAVLGSGGVMCWGENAYGQLGNGSDVNNAVPVEASGLSGVAAVTAGYQRTCAVLHTGALMCWGSDRGSLPTLVNEVSAVASVALGYSFTCVRTTAGAVECWGTNEEGQLGDGTTTTRYTPGAVSGLSDVVAIAAGYYSSCARTSSGAVKCWGWNGSGQLGDGSTTSGTVSVDAVLGDAAISIDVGSNHACAVTSAGRVKCWGSNEYGQLGNGRTNVESTPATISRPITDAVTLAAGYAHTCALTRSGSVMCWGANWLGQLGNGTMANQYIPVWVTGLSDVAVIAPAWYHTCAVTRSGSAMCWGYNVAGQLGDGTSQTRLTPVGVNGLGSGVTSVVAGYYHSCAVMQTGGVKCWGYNGYGELGDGTKTDSHVPVDVVGLTGVTAIATGSFSHHVCALASGHVKCWGENGSGQLGDGTWTNRLTPVQVNGLSNVTALAVGSDYTCALIQTGKVKCWGGNESGQLGSSTSLSSTTPLEVSGLSNIVAISAGIIHTCALTNTGVVKCWGGNLKGPDGVTSVAVGGYQTCALLNTGEIICRGSSEYGSLGIDPGWTPVTVIGFGFDHMLYLPQMQHP